MAKKNLPKSIRKYIRQEKARIRREILDLKEQERLIKELYQKLHANSARSAKDSRNVHPTPKIGGGADAPKRIKNTKNGN